MGRGPRMRLLAKFGLERAAVASEVIVAEANPTLVGIPSIAYIIAETFYKCFVHLVDVKNSKVVDSEVTAVKV
jgi:hypothetical protein